MSKVEVSGVIKEGNTSHRNLKVNAPIRKMVDLSNVVFTLSSYDNVKKEKVIFNVSAVTIKDYISLLVNSGKKNGPKEIPLNIAVKFDENKTRKDNKGNLYKEVVGVFLPHVIKSQDGKFEISTKTKEYTEQNGYDLLKTNTPMSAKLFISDGIDNKIIASVHFEKEPNEKNSYVMGQKMLSQLDSVYKVMDGYGFIEIPANTEGKVGVKYSQNGHPYNGHFISLIGGNNVEFKVVENGTIEIEVGNFFTKAITEKIKKEREQQQAPQQAQTQPETPVQPKASEAPVPETPTPEVPEAPEVDEMEIPF